MSSAGALAARDAVCIVEIEDRQRRHHHAPVSLGGAVESFDEQDIAAVSLCQLDRRHVHPGAAGQFYGDVLGFNHRIGVGGRGELAIISIATRSRVSDLHWLVVIHILAAQTSCSC